MKKVLFLMFLLFLCLGAANVNAQVRIGGNAAPNGAAVLDLNATDAATGTKGLALPRVRLDSTTVQITPGVANLNGMLVYNTTATLGAGIYFWNNTVWVRASLPATSSADSGKFLMSNGTSWVTMQSAASSVYINPDSISRLRFKHDTIVWTRVLDTTINVTYIPNRYVSVYVNGLAYADLCAQVGAANTPMIFANTNTLIIAPFVSQTITTQRRIICYRPN